MDTTSPTLLQRVKDARDEKAWREFFGLYYPLITRYGRIRGLCESEAEEVAQDCMKNLAGHMRRFHYSRDRGKFRQYLQRVVNNRIANLYGRGQPRAGRVTRQARTGELERLASAEVSDTQWDQAWQREHLAYCVAKLESRCSDRTVKAFRLYALEEWPVEKVCRKLGVTANQVYLAKTRMIRRLRKEVTQLVGDVW